MVRPNGPDGDAAEPEPQPEARSVRPGASPFPRGWQSEHLLPCLPEFISLEAEKTSGTYSLLLGGPPVCGNPFGH